MKIAITGATGFLGANLVRHFARSGHEVLALGRVPEPPARLRDFADWQQADNDRPLDRPIEADVVVHAAANVSGSAPEAELVRGNILGTKHVAEASAAARLFVQISSSSVYSYHDGKPRGEADAGLFPEKMSAYGRSKWQAELALAAVPKPAGQTRLVLRPRAIYGVGDRVLLPWLLGMVRRGRFVSPGPMAMRISMTHETRIARCVQHFLENEGRFAGRELTFNIADPEPYPMGDTVFQFLKTMHDGRLKRLVLPLAILRFLAKTGLSKRITPFVLNTVTLDSVLNVNALQAVFPLPGELNLPSEAERMRCWVASLGGVGAFLKNAVGAPWAGDFD